MGCISALCRSNSIQLPTTTSRLMNIYNFLLKSVKKKNLNKILQNFVVFCLWSRLISTFLLFPMFFYSLFEDDMINQLTSFSTRLFTISTKGQSIVVNKGWLSPNLIFFNRKEGNYNWIFWFYSYLNSHLVSYLSWNYSYFFFFTYFPIL